MDLSNSDISETLTILIKSLKYARKQNPQAYELVGSASGMGKTKIEKMVKHKYIPNDVEFMKLVKIHNKGKNENT